MDELAEDVRRHVPEQLVTANKDEAQAADITSQSLELEYLHKVLVNELKYIEKPFEWAYEGLGPLLLRDVLETKRGFSFSLAILFSCIARRLGMCLTPVPVSQTDTGTSHSIAGADLSRWLLRHDGACC
ncbi:hypothetical protein WJX75_008964 [Coccomyxa subellipsoidea]|uniref:Protein SirB1 N-terminal domain-containing protein n=1 Tax=Coccomyxa subellipsoidea TaxID=248742 RepID=A0ABR2YCV5_9CHLO